MKRFLYLFIGLFLLAGELYSQSYGLQFSSHDAIPEKRTSVNLTPVEPLCLKGDTQISFDLKFVPGLNAYFGYVIRVITTDNQNIDIVSIDKTGNFNFVIGESFSYAFKIDSSSLFGKWNHCEIRFDKNNKEVSFFLNNRLVTTGKLNFTNATCYKVFFGTNNIDCLIKPESPDGIIASCGSQKEGWAIFLENGVPGFVVAHDKHLQFIDGTSEIINKWSHLVAVIENYNNVIKLFADGKLIGQRKMLLPIQSLNSNDGDIYLGQDSGDKIDPT